MIRQRTIAACHAAATRDQFDRIWQRQTSQPEVAGDYSLDGQLTQARREMGEERWAQLNAEWETPARDVRGMMGEV